MVKEDLIPPILHNDLIGLESADILSKKVIGKDDVDIAAIEALAKNYNEFSDAITQRIEGILNAKPKYLDGEKFQAYKDVFEARISANKQHIARKKKEASTIVTLETLQNVMDEIAVEIADANTKAKEHNATIGNLSKEKPALISQIWCFIVEEIKLTYGQSGDTIPIYLTY
ncbi:MAG: AAA family ATPase [Candidatus Scalindua rubra]|uniref:Protein CR006 P-loop domain-containing protein n=1 Tax=Candidatus Scalindua brodae TaxID=237368 RepID=A0A0B0EHR8_9BACT|nr:MAG: hypothetical protein SCABRO_04046 [Candidatus Scalindua brodae]MBZ0107783.1 AAA family ATPase [Candidatus Scalindua rubra]